MLLSPLGQGFVPSSWNTGSNVWCCRVGDGVGGVSADAEQLVVGLDEAKNALRRNICRVTANVLIPHSASESKETQTR